MLEFKDDIPDGNGSIYNADGSISITQTAKNGEVISSKNINYKLQKTGVPEYDNIDFSNGEIIAYYNEAGELVPEHSENIYTYRKSFGKTKDNKYLLVDYYAISNLVQGISKSKYIYTSLPNSEEKTTAFFFHQNGNIEFIIESNELHNITEHFTPFGKKDFIFTMNKNGNIINMEYPE